MRKDPVGRIEDIPRFITFIQSQLKEDWPASPNDRKTYCMIVGDYGGPWPLPPNHPFVQPIPYPSPIGMIHTNDLRHKRVEAPSL